MSISDRSTAYFAPKMQIADDKKKLQFKIPQIIHPEQKFRINANLIFFSVITTLTFFSMVAICVYFSLSEQWSDLKFQLRKMEHDLGILVNDVA